jgi:hypothetical protein
MSRVGVIVALLVALVLAVAAALLLRPGPPASASSAPLLQVDAAGITAIRIERPGAPPQAAERSGQGSWIIRLGDGLPWPAMGERIRPALRIVSNLELIRPADGGADIGDSATVTITVEDGTVHRVRLGVHPLAGAVLGEYAGPEVVRRGWVDAKLVDMLVTTGMSEWRDRSAMGQLGPEVSRLSLRSGDRHLSFGRVDGRWALMTPVAQPCEPDAVARLFTLVGQTAVEDFLDQGAPTDTGLESPAAVLTAESTFRDPADPTRSTTEIRRLEVGRIADVGGKTVFARLSGETSNPQNQGFWRRVVVLNGLPLAEIPSDPAHYIARKCLQTPAADIGRLEVYGGGDPGALKAAFQRDLDGWRQSGAAQQTITTADAAGLHRLLELLTASPAEGVLLSEPPGMSIVASVEVQSIGGMPLARVSLGRMAEGRPVLGNEGVWRVYPATVGPAVEWLPGHREPPAGLGGTLR